MGKGSWKHILVCPMDDTILFAGVDSAGGLKTARYIPPADSHSGYPFVPAYFERFDAQRKAVKGFLREKGFSARSFLLALPDDATDLEARALSELLIDCGAKETVAEYRAFLLSGASAYIAVTASKRCVAVSSVDAAKDDTERVFIPLPEVTEEQIRKARQELDPSGKLPLFSFGLEEPLPKVGTVADCAALAENFLAIL